MTNVTKDQRRRGPSSHKTTNFPSFSDDSALNSGDSIWILALAAGTRTTKRSNCRRKRNGDVAAGRLGGKEVASHIPPLAGPEYRVGTHTTGVITRTAIISSGHGGNLDNRKAEPMRSETRRCRATSGNSSEIHTQGKFIQSTMTSQ